MKNTAALLAFAPLLLSAPYACAAPHTAHAITQSADDSFRLGDPEGDGSYDAPFFAEARYSDRFTDPADVLGQTTGSRMATDAELFACFEAWAKESDPLPHNHHLLHVPLFQVTVITSDGQKDVYRQKFGIRTVSVTPTQVTQKGSYVSL